MKMYNSTNDFEQIVIQERPLIDVRAPIEFEKGAFLNAVNLPLMNNEERRLVGTCYKEEGNKAAVQLGHQLVSGATREARIDAWEAHIKKHPETMLYCFRGGLRSEISQDWIFHRTGKNIIRLEGGYKAFRNYLINNLDPQEQKSTPILLAGYTGSGKTLLLKRIENSIDLEGLAHHRGSSFGRQIVAQPTQITFENNLAYKLIQHRNKAFRYLIVEDESKNIGKCMIPKPLYEYFNQGHLILLSIPFEERVKNTLNEYVIQSQSDYIKLFGNELGLSEWSNYISTSMKKIKNRLGGDLHQRVVKTFEQACKEQIFSGNQESHKTWIEILLREYYDPMYDYQSKKIQKPVLFKGDGEDVLQYLRNFHSERLLT
ncbi:MAG: tRNA 2-selenouridine(34) synthase MnmH [Peptococcales bacterium]|jgi:tRNA 2-selenouridine synthase